MRDLGSKNNVKRDWGRYLTSVPGFHIHECALVHMCVYIWTHQEQKRKKLLMKMNKRKKEKGPVANLTYFWYTPQLDDSSACLELANGPYYAHTSSLSLVFHSFIWISHYIRLGAPVYQGWDSMGSHLQEYWWQMATSIHAPTWSNWLSRTFQLQV